MARGPKIKWNIPAFEAIRRLPGVDAALQEHVSGVLDDVGTDGYVGGVEPGKSRSRGYVVTRNYSGILDNEQNASLVRALGRRMGGAGS